MAELRGVAREAAAAQKDGAHVADGETASIVSTYRKLVAEQLTAAEQLHDAALETWVSRYERNRTPVRQQPPFLNAILEGTRRWGVNSCRGSRRFVSEQHPHVKQYVIRYSF